MDEKMRDQRNTPGHHHVRVSISCSEFLFYLDDFTCANHYFLFREYSWYPTWPVALAHSTPICPRLSLANIDVGSKAVGAIPVSCRGISVRNSSMHTAGLR